MKLLVVLCFVAAVAQAIDVDWNTIDTMQVAPADIAGALDESARDQVGTRIVGGQEATPGQFPWQVGMIAATPWGNGFCGGSILNEEWILTAAHCVDTATSIELIIGAHNVVQGDDTQFRVPVVDVVIHRSWNPNTIKDDVALLKIGQKLEYNERVQPIRLPSRLQMRNNFAGATGIVSGWGLDSDSATAISPVLRWVQNPVMQNSRCTLFYFGTILSTQICLSGSGGRSSCQGDSGGPLVIVDSDGQFTQIGVVSHGIVFGCASGWPGVYARVTSYLDWIETQTGGAVRIRD